MSLPTPEVRHYHVEMITDHHLLTGLLEPYGTLITYLNNPERRTVQLKNVTISALDTTSTVSAFSADELWTRRDVIVLIRLLDEVSAATVPLLPFRELLRVFIPPFVVQGQFSRGQDTKVADIFEAMSGNWAPALEAQVYPLLASKAHIAQGAHAVLLSKPHIQFYQSVRETPGTGG